MVYFTPHVLIYIASVNFKRRDGLGSVFERFTQSAALRIARELGVLRQYVRGKRNVVRDIARSFELYEQMFSGPPPD